MTDSARVPNVKPSEVRDFCAHGCKTFFPVAGAWWCSLALADRLAQADAALAACDKWISLAVDIDSHTQDNVLARIALPIVREIRRALDGGAS